MSLSRRISRQRNVRLAFAALFVVCAAGALAALLVLGGSSTATIVIPSLVLLSALPIAIAPTRTMDARWFHLLPALVTIEAAVTMYAVAPHCGAVAPIFVFNGPLVAFLMTTRRAQVGQLTLASVLLLAPIPLGIVDAAAVMTILASFAVMWGLALCVAVIWTHAEDAAARLDQLAQRDALTGVGNRRHFDERLATEIAHHARAHRPLTLVVLDLNGFKEINDTLGHTAGDEVLRSVGRALTGVVRAEDTIARPGGDEFCVLAPGTDGAGAEVVVGAIRTALAGVDAGGRPLRAGIGWATFPDDARRPTELFEVADARQRADKPITLSRAV
ncbi:MAG: GGDEF domain-containing protein [Solirubrobacteraceae bacterium]|nr:GGDEF domain-containing protein [Solirubrobacteraceae bacterium]